METQSRNIHFEYPVTKRVKFTHGDSKLEDPYVWLEETQSDETNEWVNKQNQLTRSYLDTCKHKNKIYEALDKSYNYPRTGLSSLHKDGYYYWYHNNGTDNHNILYRSKEMYQNGEIFFDPNKLSEDGTISVGTMSFSKSGSLFAYIEHVNGSDWGTIRLINCQTKNYLPDVIANVKFSSISITLHDDGIFYSRYLSSDNSESSVGTQTDVLKNHSIFYHKIGTSQDNDLLIYTVDNTDYTCVTEFSYDKKYLMIRISDGCNDENKVYYIDMDAYNKDCNEHNFNIVKLVDNFNASYNMIHNIENIFYLFTTLDAPKHKVISMDINSGEIKTIINESSNNLTNVDYVNNGLLLLTYSEHIHDVLKVFSLQDNVFLDDISLPSFGSVSTTTKPENHYFDYSFTSYIHPSVKYRFDFTTYKSTIIMDSQVPNYDPNDYEVEQIFYESKDKTRIPMYITKKRGRRNNGLMLYGYGGFNVGIYPYFSSLLIPLLSDLGIDYAVANIRGGDEYGIEWYNQGKREFKQNVFDDFQCAGDFLINNGYVDHDKLIINGASNGGLLVGACINQRPDLFRIGICEVGVLDMTRFHKFTIGHAWKSDYGDPDVKEDFDVLIKYSPYHNVDSSKKYPAVLITTADHDDRVVPLHSYKFISELQYKLGSNPYQNEPLMILVETKTGHGSGKPRTKVLQEYTDVYAFICNVLDINLN